MNIYRYFFPSRWAEHERRKVAPKGFLFLRNYKKSHLNRLHSAMDLRGLGKGIVIVDTAYDNSGDLIPHKLAVYASNQSVGGLFFQAYSYIKSQEKYQITGKTL